MAYKFDKAVDRKRVRDGDGWKTAVTITVITSDDADADFEPFTSKVSGNPVDTAAFLVMGVSMVAKINAELTVRKAEADLVEAEETLLNGKILDKIDTYLTANVGI